MLGEQPTPPCVDMDPLLVTGSLNIDVKNALISFATPHFPLPGAEPPPSPHLIAILARELRLVLL